MSGALQAVYQNQRSFGPPPGQQAYSSPGTYTWVAPTGVTKVSVVAVGGGGAGGFYACTKFPGGGGGALAYANNITVVPGNSYSVVVGAGGVYTACLRDGGTSSFNSTSVAAQGGRSNWTSSGVGGAGGTVLNGTGGSGGAGGCYTTGGFVYLAAGGGAGGYSGAGGKGANASNTQISGSSGSGGGGGGGGSANDGGAVGLKGQGANGAGGAAPFYIAGCGSSASPNRGAAGKGGGLAPSCIGSGGVRIIWPGCARSFPSTCTGDK